MGQCSGSKESPFENHFSVEYDKLRGILDKEEWDYIGGQHHQVTVAPRTLCCDGRHRWETLPSGTP